MATLSRKVQLHFLSSCSIQGNSYSLIQDTKGGFFFLVTVKQKSMCGGPPEPMHNPNRVKQGKS